MATTEEIRGDLAEIVNEVAGIPADDVQLDKSFVDDLDVDSLSMVEVVVAAEEKFDVKIPDDEVKNLKTVGDAVAFIERAQNGGPTAVPPSDIGGRSVTSRSLFASDVGGNPGENPAGTGVNHPEPTSSSPRPDRRREAMPDHEVKQT
jgi:acyl carrier protein